MTRDEFATPERILISDFAEKHILTIKDENEFVALICSILWRRAIKNDINAIIYCEYFADTFRRLLSKDNNKNRS